jgi:hypothetical protein
LRLPQLRLPRGFRRHRCDLVVKPVRRECWY